MKELKIGYFSDTHIDYYIKQKQKSNKLVKQLDSYLESIGAKEERDILILAGDIGDYFIQNSEFILELKKYTKYLVLTYGNHDLYLCSKNQQNKYLNNSNNRKLELKQFCIENDIIFLDGNVVFIEGIKIAGLCMSWDGKFNKQMQNGISDEKEEMKKIYDKNMSDAKYIMFGKKPLLFKDGMSYNKRVISKTDPFEFFKEERKKLDEISSLERIDIMVSHYPPIIPKNIPKEYIDDDCSSFYYFDGKKDIERISPKYWIFGHTHVDYNFKENETNLLCNPIGYPVEKGKMPQRRIKDIIFDIFT